MSDGPGQPRSSSPPASISIDVVAGLIFRNGRLLITQRPPNSHLGGLWEFPGGKCEPGESDEQALKRELREELGACVAVEQLIDTVTHHYPAKTVCIRFHRCRLTSGEPAPLGCQNLEWVTHAELDDYNFPEADAQLLDRLRSEPGFWGESHPPGFSGPRSAD
jgi:mutator protein MutT